MSHASHQTPPSEARSLETRFEPDVTREKYFQARAWLRQRVVAGGPELDGMLRALMLGQHVLLLGPPGTAKSMKAADVGKLVQAEGDSPSESSPLFFRALMHPHMLPDDLLGPVDLPALLSNPPVQRRNGEGMLPGAVIAFLDEIFNARPTYLGMLLTLLNERQFEGKDVPLWTVIGASNGMPVPDQGYHGAEVHQGDAGVAALRDRFLLSFVVDPIKGGPDFCTMMSGQFRQVSDIPPVCFSPGELRHLRGTWLPQVELSPKFIASALLPLRDELARSGVPLSDRRWRWIGDLLRLGAWLANRPAVTSVDLAAILPALWLDPAHITLAKTALENVAAPEMRVVSKVAAELDAALVEVDKRVAAQKGQGGSDAQLEVDKAYEALDKAVTSTLMAIKEITDAGFSSPDLDGLLGLARGAHADVTAHRNRRLSVVSFDLTQLLADLPPLTAGLGTSPKASKAKRAKD